MRGTARSAVAARSSGRDSAENNLQPEGLEHEVVPHEERGEIFSMAETSRAIDAVTGAK
jgi:hypothetical protein